MRARAKGDEKAAQIRRRNGNRVKITTGRVSLH